MRESSPCIRASCIAELGSSNRVREFAVLRIRGCQGAQHKGVRASDQSIGLFRKLNRLRTISK